MPEIAETVLGCLDAGTQTAPFSGRPEGLTLERAYQVTAELRVLREARGERRVGRKLGFTNKRLWPEFGIDAPIWGDIFDTTVTENRRAMAVCGCRGRRTKDRTGDRVGSGNDARARHGCSVSSRLR